MNLEKITEIKPIQSIKETIKIVEDTALLHAVVAGALLPMASESMKEHLFGLPVEENVIQVIGAAAGIVTVYGGGLAIFGDKIRKALPWNKKFSSRRSSEKDDKSEDD